MNNHHQTITLRNYASQHIYNIISIRYPNLDPQEKKLKIQSIFKELVNNVRTITTTQELDVYNTPMSFLFQHIRPTIIELVANCSPIVDKLFIERALINNIDWNIRFFNTLQNLGSRDIIVWFFLHIPYYNNENDNSDNSYNSHNMKYHSNQIDKQRDVYIKMLEYMIVTWSLSSYFTETEFVFLSNQTCMPYASAYHNRNNKLLLETYCKLLRKICPWINYYSPTVAEKIIKKEIHQNFIKDKSKKNICFISDSFTTDTSVLRDRVTIIGKLDRNRYNVYFASFYPFESIQGIIAKVFMERIKTNYIYLGETLSNARLVLETYKFDVIVYPDIGMKLLPSLLAYSRIAPVQITTWGHSETSGIDTIDYFISSEYFENMNTTSSHQPQDNYTEKLILFKSLGTFYISPHKLFIENNPKYINKIKQFKTKNEYGLSKENNIYACLQTFYKITSEFEECLARILELDPNGIILLSNTFPYCKSHLMRIKQIVGDEKIKRIIWIGSIEKDEYLNIISISDVCLDPFPFGGFNTSYDAFDYNIPVITMGNCNFLHGQFTSGLYRKMGLDECIVSNPEEYAKLASQIGINEKLRHKINRNIEMKKNLIFQEQASVEEWNKLFHTLLV